MRMTRAGREVNRGQGHQAGGLVSQGKGFDFDFLDDKEPKV